MITLIVGVSFLVVSVSMLGSFTLELLYFKERLKHEYQAAAKMLSKNLEAAVLFENENDCREILSHLVTYETIATAGVYTPAGELLAEFRNPSYGDDLPVPPMTVSESVEGHWILLSEEISVDDTTIGFLVLRADFGELLTFLLSRGSVFAVILVIALIAAASLGLKLSKFVSAPIVQLTQMAKSISRSKDFSKRQERISKDETGELVDAFNEMLEEVESRNKVISANEERFRRYFELGVVGMAVLGDELRWVHFNDKLVEILGYRREELYESSFFQILDEGTKSDVFKELHGLSSHSNSGYVGECWLRGASNRNIYAIASFKGIVDVESGRKQNILLLQDITDRKRHEEELINAKEKAEASSQAKDDFLSIMSHELRTPLNPILGFSELLKDHLDDKEDMECVNIISKSANHLLDLIGNILDYTRIDRGVDSIEKSTFDCVKISDEIVTSFRVEAEQRGLELTAENYLDGRLLADSQNIVISTDKVKLKQILHNIVSNALKFTNKGKITVIARFKTTESPRLRIDVKDTGIGIKEEDKEKVFEAFSQVDGSMTRNYGGVGLGMAISKKIVKGLGGCIDFESTIGVGSSFWFELPVKIDLVETAEKPMSEHQSRLIDGMIGVGIAPVLLVEDEPNNRQLAALILESRGFRVVFAENGEKAVSLAEQKKFGLIFMDLQMPVLDGFDTSRKIRSCDSKNFETPIIALTAHADDEVQKKCELAGMDDYLAKPFSPKQLVEKLTKWTSDLSARKLDSNLWNTEPGEIR
ncbi:response regulator [Puniceicoccaceae bacterium K14]|nr:response regulator [Puniceicoccaceae bacterium K14]